MKEEWGKEKGEMQGKREELDRYNTYIIQKDYGSKSIGLSKDIKEEKMREQRRFMRNRTERGELFWAQQRLGVRQQ